MQRPATARVLPYLPDAELGAAREEIVTRMKAQSDYWPVSFRRSCAAPIQPGRCGSGDSASVTAQCTRSMHTGCRGTDVRASVGRAVVVGGPRPTWWWWWWTSEGRK